MCKEHHYILTEVEGDSAGGSWRAHTLMCAKCLHILHYREVLKLHQAKPANINEDIIDI